MSEGEVSAPSSEASIDTGSDEGSNNEQSLEPEKPKPKPPKMRKIKVDGKEEFVNEDDVFRDYQKYKAADKRMAEAAKLRQESEDRWRKLKDDPYSVLSDPELGLNPNELAEQWLTRQLQEELEVDPRDKEMRELQKRLEEYQKRDQEKEEQEKMTERERFIESRKEAIQKTLVEAMEASILSKNPETQAAMLREMALYMRAAKEQGEEVTAQDIVEHIQSSRFNQYHTLANQFEGDELINFLGEAVVNKIRKADLERLRSKRAQTQSFKPDDKPFDLGQKKGKHLDPNEIRFAMRNMD